MDKGRLFVISGPSGTGKGTLCKLLLDEVEAALSVSMTTRGPRPGETDGKDYIFTTHEEFERFIASDGFLEYAGVYGNYYGTPRQRVMDKLAEGADVILEIDTQGAFQIKDKCPGAVLIFILPPSMEELRRRLEGRGSETEDAIKLRLGETLKEIMTIGKYDYYVVNTEPAEAVTKLRAIIAAEHLKVLKHEDVERIVEKYKEDL